jgi:hypothetical protein
MIMRNIKTFNEYNRQDEGLKSAVVAGAIGAASLFGGKSNGATIDDSGKKSNKISVVKKDMSINYGIMNAWNHFINFLQKEGLSGSSKMNNVDFSKSIFDKYKKLNPSSVLTYDHTFSIQKAIRNYKEESIDKMKSGEIKKSDDIKDDYSNFMPWVDGTDDDGIIGQYTSLFKFPLKYMGDGRTTNLVNK